MWNNLAPSELGIGFTDIGLFVGSDAQEFSAETMREWSKDFYARSRAHSKRCGADPLIVAFTGARLELFSSPHSMQHLAQHFPANPFEFLRP